MKSGAPHASCFGSFVAVIPEASDSMSVLSAGRWVCSVAFPACKAFSICRRYRSIGLAVMIQSSRIITPIRAAPAHRAPNRFNPSRACPEPAEGSVRERTNATCAPPVVALTTPLSLPAPQQERNPWELRRPSEPVFARGLPHGPDRWFQDRLSPPCS